MGCPNPLVRFGQWLFQFEVLGSDVCCLVALGIEAEICKQNIRST